MGLIYQVDGAVARVGLNRPEALNALDPDTLLELRRAWDEVNRDEAVRAVILYSALPDIFCSGMDLKTSIPVLTRMRPPQTEAERWVVDDWADVGHSMLKPNPVKKPVIAAIHGYCLTGGFEMVMGADLRLASEDAIFQMREAKLGIMPTGGGNVYLTRQLSPCRGLELLLTADNFDAATMERWGFLNRVVPRENLMAEAEKLADRIAANGPLAVKGIIRCWRESRDLPMAEAMKLELEIGLPIFGSQDAREGVTAQKEKRKPVFPGKY